MIEIIYDKDKKNEKFDEDKQLAGEVSIGLKLPKNIRQVGAPSGNKRIYIEDYVVTYLNYIARPGSTQARGAILLGEIKQSDVGNVIFISGAVDAQNIEFDMDESEFTQEAWSKIYEQVKEYFPNLSVVGWFLSRMGFSTAVNDKIQKMHVENFPGKDKVLFITDSLESDDAFYTYDRGQLIKQKGYYIYYARNEQMQNYIISRKGGDSVEDSSEIQRKDEELIKNYRSKNSKIRTKTKSNISLVYVASAFIVMAIFAMAVTVVSNYDKMKEMEVTINRLEMTSDEYINDNNITETMNVVTPTQTDTSIAMDIGDGQGTDESGNDKLKESNSTNVNDDENVDNSAFEKKEDEEIVTKTQYLPTMNNGNPTYYRIKKGDSLTSIALEYYGNSEYAINIAKANDIKLDDDIFEGEEIILPSIKN